MRWGRYNIHGKIEQQIEIRNDEISNAITTVQKDSLIIENKLNQLVYINSNKQGNRVYDDGLTSTIRAIGGGISRSGSLHLIKNNIKERGNYMWKNELEKFDFKMEGLKLFDAFAGKGALYKSLKKLGMPVKVVALYKSLSLSFLILGIDDFCLIKSHPMFLLINNSFILSSEGKSNSKSLNPFICTPA